MIVSDDLRWRRFGPAFDLCDSHLRVSFMVWEKNKGDEIRQKLNKYENWYDLSSVNIAN